MRQTIALIVLMAVVVSASAWAGPQDAPEVHWAIGLQRGTLVAELSALQDLREGKTPEAIARLEAHCYSTAVVLLESSTWRTNSTVRLFVAELDKYRKQHVQPGQEWSPTEKRLEELLKELKDVRATNHTPAGIRQPADGSLKPTQ